MNEVKSLKSKRQRLLKQLRALGGWALGSLVETERIQSGRKKPFRYLSRSVQGKNRITYVSAKQFRLVKEQLKAGHRAKRLFEQIAELTVAIIKAESKRVGGHKK